MQIDGKRILLTGGSSGIGLETARALKAKGARLCITGRRPDALEAAATELGCAYAVADVGTPEGVAATVAAAQTALGGIDVLINNAGIGEFERVEDVTWEMLEQVFAVNVFGPAMLAAAVVPGMKAQGQGTIVNIASTSSQRGFALGSVYGSSKFALRGMTQCWQEELRRYNIRVCQINPSEVTTAFHQPGRRQRPAEAHKLRPQEIAHTLVAVLELDDRAFVPEVSVWATNPF